MGNGQWYALFIEDRSSDFTFDWALHWSLLAQGENEISITVVDKAGNYLTHYFVSGIQGFLFRKDSTPPHAPEISSDTHPSESAWFSNNNPVVHWSTSSDLSGIQGFSFILDDIPNTIPDNVSEGPEEQQQYFHLNDGVWYFHCRAVDGAGNWGETDHYTVRIDVTDPGPPMNLTREPDGWTNSNSFHLNWTDPEDISGIALAYYTFNEEPTSDTGDVFSPTRPLTIEVPEEGEHSVYVWLQDNAGNAEKNNTASISVFYDVSGPVYGTISIADGAEVTESLTVDLTGLSAQDELSGVELMQFSNDGETWSPAESYTEEKDDWDLASYGGTSDPGNKTVSVRYGDATGNWSDAVYDEILYCPPLEITTSQLRTAVIDVPYSATLEATGGLGYYNWSIVSGSLPQGLNLNAMTGDILGTPAAHDTFTAFFTVQVIDSTHSCDTQDLSITICERVQGDANGDGTINILDGLDVVNMILSNSCSTMEGNIQVRKIL